MLIFYVGYGFNGGPSQELGLVLTSLIMMPTQIFSTPRRMLPWATATSEFQVRALATGAKAKGLGFGYVRPFNAQARLCGKGSNKQ